MLTPKIVDVSEKGQILIPVAMRQALGVKPQGKVFLLPRKKEKKIEIMPIKGTLVDELYGMFAHIEKKASWTKELERERRQDLMKEETRV